jgi:hypothetical protein
MLTAAASQDLIRWMEFLHGKVSKEIRRIQEVHCTLSPCRITGTDLMKLLVTHLIQLFRDSVDALTGWMNNHNQTDAELAYWIEKYLIFRGTWSFTS